MKTFTIAAAITAMTVTAASAEGLLGGLGGSAEAEYSIENETFSMEAGPDFSFGGFSIEPRAYASIDADNNFDFDGVGVEAAYGVTRNLSVYGAVQTDGDLEYSDAQVGVRFNF